VHVVDLHLLIPLVLGGMHFESSLQINNLLEYNYVDLIGSIAPGRNFVLTLAASFSRVKKPD
jgi:outer membrane receptor protein involved in Fe transport